MRNAVEADRGATRPRTRWTLGPLLAFLFLASRSGVRRVACVSYVTRMPAPSVRVPILVYHSVVPTHPGQNPAATVARRGHGDVPAADVLSRREQVSGRTTGGSGRCPAGAWHRAAGRSRSPSMTDGSRSTSTRCRSSSNALPRHLLRRSRCRSARHRVHGAGRAEGTSAAGMTIASHTRTHPDLGNVWAAQLRDEMAGSRQDLQKMLGVTTDLFAYPYGCGEQSRRRLVTEAGYRAARALGGAARTATSTDATRSTRCSRRTTWPRSSGICTESPHLGALGAPVRVATSVSARWFDVLQRVP